MMQTYAIPDTFEQSLGLVASLVGYYQSNLQAFRASTYKEAHARQDLIDPLFIALGWDVHNTQRVAPDYRDVIVEDMIEIAGQKKAPDYVFRLARERKFFVEAKRPGITIKTSAEPAYQLRRYAWSAKLSLSILTDFEELAIYDCRVRPSEKDKASLGRIKFFTYGEYPDRWRELWDVFSRPAVLDGALERAIQEGKRQRGTSTVDAEFLKEIEGWRDRLARNIAVRNTDLSHADLSDCVQRMIDRIVFLRIAEDRGLEEYGRLMRATEGEGVYAALLRLYTAANTRYNSELFDFTASGDQSARSLVVDDTVLRTILVGLYFPHSPYEFSVLPPEMLGNVYEQFLGKVIRLTDMHRAKVEERPEVRKAGGVYYTPAYIVEYVVRQTLGPLVAGKGPQELIGLHIIDPACGSGSFLLGVYQFLLDHYHAWYVANEPSKHKHAVVERDGGWRLTTSERKRILIEHVYGVDLDRQAVEVTKLSLLLKVLEVEGGGSVQLTLLGGAPHARALPTLGRNIKCGNSLIGSDYFTGQMLPEESELRQVNPFDWKREFREVMQSGGFDAVVGNPPYVRSQALGDGQRTYYASRYQTATGTYDIYVLFIERAMDLIRADGRIGLIVPNKFFTTDYGEGLRKLIGYNQWLDKLVDFGDGQVFAQAGTYTTLLFLQRGGNHQPSYASLGEVFRVAGRAGLALALARDAVSFAQIDLTVDGTRWTLATGQSGVLLHRLQKNYPPLASFGPHIFQGLKTSADPIYLLEAQSTKGRVWSVTNGLGETCLIEHALLKPVVKGEHVLPYHADRSASLFILYPYEMDAEGHAVLIGSKRFAQEFPKAWEYLNLYRKQLGARDGGKWAKRADWYAYARGQNIGTFLGRKFMVPYMTTHLRTALDESGELFFVNITTGGYGLRVDIPNHSDYYLLGLLNSALMNYCIQQMTNRFRGGYMAVNKQALERLPFRQLDFSKPEDVRRHDHMVALIKRMLELEQRMAGADSVMARATLERQISVTCEEIDALVYDLYQLTEAEIALI